MLRRNIARKQFQHCRGISSSSDVLSIEAKRRFISAKEKLYRGMSNQFAPGGVGFLLVNGATNELLELFDQEKPIPRSEIKVSGVMLNGENTQAVPRAVKPGRKAKVSEAQNKKKKEVINLPSGHGYESTSVKQLDAEVLDRK